MRRYSIVAAWPAYTAAFIAASVTAAVAAITLFGFFPPLAVSGGETGHIDLDAIGRTLRAAILGTRCDGILETLLSVDCHLAPLSRLIEALGSTREARLSTGFALAAPAFAGTFAFIDSLIHTPPTEAVQTRRGRAITYGEYARRAMRRLVAARGGRANGLWLLPHVRLNRTLEARNILLLGGHGSGKTGWLRGLIEQLLDRAGKTFILDVKGDMIEGLPSGRFILVAAADGRSWAWDIAADLRTRLHAAEFAKKIVAAAERDPMWGHAARAILADLIVHLQRGQQQWGWQELSALVLSTPAEIRDVLSAARARSAVLLGFDRDEEENRTLLSILTTLWVAALTEIVPLAQAWAEVPIERRFSLRDWVRRDSSLPPTLVFQKSAEYPELSGAIGAHIVDAIAAFVLSPARRSVGADGYAMVLDEFPELGIAAERLPQLLALGREAGVVTIATLQDLAQLEDVYNPTKAGLIAARFGIRCVLALEDGETTHRVSESWIGDRELRRERERSHDEIKGRIGHAFETVTEPVLASTAMVDELGVIERGELLWARAVVLGFATVARIEIPLTIWRKRRVAFEPASWLDEP